ncbi:diaminopimelate decarboxylase [Candidatus Peregrinibacteria bacterium]|nr:diaminopimelate decarboxylase [Candidatus Peregrinibacteria bacterium]
MMNTTINQEVLYYPSDDINRAVQQLEAPFFIYEERRLRENLRNFRDSFRQYFPDFIPLFAVKANPNPQILRIVMDEAYGFDCSSESETWIVDRLNGQGMFTGNFNTESDLQTALEAGLTLNLDDINLIPIIEQIGIPEAISFRINPDITHGGMESLKVAGQNAKFGIPYERAVEAYRIAQQMGVKRFGIHMMVGSNILDTEHFPKIIERLFEIIAEIRDETGIEIEFMNMGGGFGVPYHPEERSLNIDSVASYVRRVFDEQCIKFNLKEPRLMAEPGRFISANTAWLVTGVTVIKESYKKFVGVDACTTMMPRPAIYDAYHHVSVLNKDSSSENLESVSIVGRLCENNDFFAKDRLLPEIDNNDILIIHNSGGHAYAMASNYNGFLRPAEYLLDQSGEIRMIRRAETIKNLYSRTCVNLV